MLTREENRYVSICMDKVAGAKHEELANRYGVSKSTVKNAIAWGRERGLFEQDLSLKLERHIQEFRERLKQLDGWLQKEFRRDEMKRQASEGMDALPAKQLVPIFEEIREHQTKIMELEGLYRQYVNINQNNSLEQNIFIIPQTVESSGEWEKTVEEWKARMAPTTMIPEFDDELH